MNSHSETNQDNGSQGKLPNSSVQALVSLSYRGATVISENKPAPIIAKAFRIDPKSLLGHKGPLIDADLLAILDEEKIDLTLNVLDSDPDCTTKPTLVFIHGNSSSMRVFKDQTKKYSNDYRVIAVDLLGHGKSTKISEIKDISPEKINTLCAAFYNPQTMIAAIRYLLEAKKIVKAHLIGWSLGGIIVSGIAISNPELAASIVEIAAPPSRHSYQGFKKGYNDWFVNFIIPEWVSQPKRYSLEEGLTMAQHIGFEGTDAVVYAQDMANSDPQMRRHLFTKLAEYDAPEYEGTMLDRESFVHKTDLPLCFIVGEKDRGISATYISQQTKDLINPNSSVHIIPDAPHAVFKTHEKQCDEIIRNFIEKARSKLELRMS